MVALSQQRRPWLKTSKFWANLGKKSTTREFPDLELKPLISWIFLRFLSHYKAMKADICIHSIGICRLYNRFEKIQQNTTDCKISVQIRSRLHHGSSRTFTDKPGESIHKIKVCSWSYFKIALSLVFVIILIGICFRDCINICIFVATWLFTVIT